MGPLVGQLWVWRGLPGAARQGFESQQISPRLGNVLGCSREAPGAKLSMASAAVLCPAGGLRLCKDKELLWEQSDSGIPFYSPPPLFCCSLPPPPFSLSANAQQMGGNAILNATAS